MPPKKQRRSTIVPRVVFSVAVGVSVVPSLVGCGSEAAPSTIVRPATAAPVTVIAAVVVTSVVPVTVTRPAELDAGSPAAPTAEPPTTEAASPRRRRRPPPVRPAPDLNRQPPLGVAARPDDWVLYGVAVE